MGSTSRSLKTRTTLSVGAILQHLHSEQIECSDWTDSCVLVDLAALAACTLPGNSGDLWLAPELHGCRRLYREVYIALEKGPELRCEDISKMCLP